MANIFNVGKSAVGNDPNNPALNPDVQKYIYNLWGNRNPLTGTASSSGRINTMSGMRATGSMPMTGMQSLPAQLQKKLNNPFNRFSPYGGSEPRNAFSSGEQFQVMQAFPGIIDLAAAWKPQPI